MEEQKKKRVMVFVDGFNLYHSLDDVDDLHKYKWLDIIKLVSLFKKSDEYIKQVIYFTAETHAGQAKLVRQRTYNNALQFSGVKIVPGKFKDSTRRCTLCHFLYDSPEEKETDVNISISMVRNAYGIPAVNDIFNKLFIRSSLNSTSVEAIYSGL